MSTSSSALMAYLRQTPPGEVRPGFTAYLGALDTVAATAPEIAGAIVRELADQRANLKLIASENYSTLATQLAMGNLLTDKYAEGFPGHRFYAGCDNVDQIEALACSEACKLFGAAHAYVQPHSGADANLIAYWAILQTRIGAPGLEEMGASDPAKLTREQWDVLRHKLGNQRLLGLDYYSGGHLTHGYRRNISAMMFDAYSYGVNSETGLLDYDEIEQMTADIRPLILLAGYSAYPRIIDFERMSAIAKRYDATLMVDMAHFAGLVAGGVFEGAYNPIPHAGIVTSTTHKTLRGPRGGLILSTDMFADVVNKGCPLVIGGPLPHVMAAKAVAFREANLPSFKDYAHSIVHNATALAGACMAEGFEIATGGTDNHLMLLNVNRFGLTGLQAEYAVRECGITLNRNSLPYDPNGPWYTSGLRIGTPATTTLGMGEAEMREIASILKFVVANTRSATITSGENAGKPSRGKHVLDSGVRGEAKRRVKHLLDRYPVYPEIDLGLLQAHFG